MAQKFYESTTGLVDNDKSSNASLVHMIRVPERLGVIKIVRVGDQRPGGKASEFRYLLPLNQNGAEKDDGGFD